jgi:hypothetical protein
MGLHETLESSWIESVFSVKEKTLPRGVPMDKSEFTTAERETRCTAGDFTTRMRS